MTTSSLHSTLYPSVTIPQRRIGRASPKAEARTLKGSPHADAAPLEAERDELGTTLAIHSTRVTARTLLHTVGPWPVRTRTAPLASTAPRSIDGRTIWHATTGKTPTSAVAAQIAQAACRRRLHALADAADRHTLLPGDPPFSPDFR